MAFLALALFLVVLGFAFFIGKRDLLSPWFLLCLAITASFFIVILNYSKWEVKVSGTFILYVLTALIAWGAGAALVRIFLPIPDTGKSLITRMPVKNLCIERKYPANIFLVISLVCVFGYVFRLFSTVSDVPSFTGKLRQIYDNIVNNGYSPESIFIQMREIAVAIAYVNTFRLFQRLFSGKDGVSIIKLLVPIALFGIAVAVSTDRNIFLRYAIYFICIFVLFFRQNSRQRNVNLRIVQFVLIMLAFMVVIFFILGKMKQYKSDIFNSLSIYGGSGLYNFNLWLNNFDNNLMHGSSTLHTFLNSLQSIFGIDIGAGAADRFDPYIKYVTSGGYTYSSNIYSALMPYVEDFGYFGMILIPFLTGVFYEILYSWVRRCKYGYSWLIYCTLIYPVIFYPILEQLFRRFHLGLVWEVLWVSILFVVVYKRRQINDIADKYIIKQIRRLKR